MDIVLPVPPTRCVIVLDKTLPVGRLANAAAVLALTIGQRHPILVGEPLLDGAKFAHPGLIPIGIAVLAADPAELNLVREKGLAAGCDVIDFPVQGQETTNYAAFREVVAGVQPIDLTYVGVALVGQKKEIGKIVGNLALLR